jgi:hypothetical protein
LSVSRSWGRTREGERAIGAQLFFAADATETSAARFNINLRGFPGRAQGNVPMINLMRSLGAAALASIVAAPAAGQYYPQYPQYPQQTYPQYPQQTYPGYGQPYGYGQNPVGDIIDQLLGNRYNVTDRQAVRRCANAAQAQAASQYGGGYGGYGGGYSGNGGYNRGYGSARVTAITNVERRSSGLRVTGLMSSGGNGGYGYGNQGYYENRGYGGAQLSFRCNVDYNGAVTGVRVRPAGGY